MICYKIVMQWHNFYKLGAVVCLSAFISFSMFDLLLMYFSIKSQATVNFMVYV